VVWDKVKVFGIVLMCGGICDDAYHVIIDIDVIISKRAGFVPKRGMDGCGSNAH